MAGNDEMIFAAPKDKLADILAGLRHAEEYGWTIPKNYFMAHEPELPESYIKIAKMVGMDVN